MTKNETNNVAVTILLDMSGSMSGRIEVAKKAAIAMAEALKSLDIKFEVLGFNSVSDPRVASEAKSGGRKGLVRPAEALDLHIFKDFDSISMSGITQLKVGQQNPDGECVAWAAKRLALRSEKRKILIVMSDGQPSTGDTSHDILCSDLRKRIIQVKKSGMECVGVGICTDYVKHYYPEHVVINRVEDLPKMALKKLTSMLLRDSKNKEKL